MNCPRCGCKLSNDENKCLECGFEVSIFEKTYYISANLFNKALVQSIDRDLNGAEDALLKSIAFHKGNTNARDLLGLVYYESGRFGDALKQWIISASFKKDERASLYISKANDNPRLMEKYNDAIRMYNQALIYMKQRSEDMAVIQLKKAIELSPNLIEAKNLLALCYMKDGRNDLAVQLTKKVLEVDKKNEKALRYRKAMNIAPPEVKTDRPQVAKPTPIQAQQRPKPPTSTYESFRAEPKTKKGVFPVSELIAFFVGALCAAAAIYFLLSPGQSQELEKKVATLEQTITNNQSKYDSDILEKDNKIKEITKQNTELAAKNEELSKKQTALEKSQQLSKVMQLYSDGNAEEAAALLKTIDINSLPEDFKQEYNDAVDKVFPKAAMNFYNTGLNRYNNGKHDESKAAFESAIQYGVKNEYLVDSYYFLGRIAEAQGEKEVAKGYYQKLVDEFGEYYRTRTAKTRLNNL